MLNIGREKEEIVIRKGDRSTLRHGETERVQGSCIHFETKFRLSLRVVTCCFGNRKNLIGLHLLNILIGCIPLFCIKGYTSFFVYPF